MPVSPETEESVVGGPATGLSAELGTGVGWTSESRELPGLAFTSKGDVSPGLGGWNRGTAISQKVQ